MTTTRTHLAEAIERLRIISTEKERIRDVQRDVQQQQQVINEQQQKMGDAHEQIQRLTEDVQNMTHKLDESEQTNNKLTAEMRDMIARQQQQQQAYDTLTQTISDRDSHITKLTHELDVTNARMHEMISTQQQHDREMKIQHEHEVHTIHDEMMLLQEKIRQTEEEKHVITTQHEHDLKQKTSHITTLETHLHDTSHELNKLRTTLQHMTQQHDQDDQQQQTMWEHRVDTLIDEMKQKQTTIDGMNEEMIKLQQQQQQQHEHDHVQIATLQTTFDTKIHDMIMLTTQIATLQTTMDELKQQHASKITSIQDNMILQKQEQHDQHIHEMKQLHDTLVSQHDREIKHITQQHDDTIQQLTTSFNTSQTRVATLEQEITLLKRVATQVLCSPIRVHSPRATTHDTTEDVLSTPSTTTRQKPRTCMSPVAESGCEEEEDETPIRTSRPRRVTQPNITPAVMEEDIDVDVENKHDDTSTMSPGTAFLSRPTMAAALAMSAQGQSYLAAQRHSSSSSSSSATRRFITLFFLIITLSALAFGVTLWSDESSYAASQYMS